MKSSFKKVKTEHHILEDFHKILKLIEQINTIHKIVPWRVNRQQKGSSEKRFRVSYDTESGFKCIMSKGSTAQELFIICDTQTKEQTKLNIQQILIKQPEIITGSNIKKGINSKQ